MLVVVNRQFSLTVVQCAPYNYFSRLNGTYCCSHPELAVTMTSANMDSTVKSAKSPFDVNSNTTAASIRSSSLYPYCSTINPLDKLNLVTEGKNIVRYLV